MNASGADFIKVGQSTIRLESIDLLWEGVDEVNRPILNIYVRGIQPSITVTDQEYIQKVLAWVEYNSHIIDLGKIDTSKLTGGKR